MAAATWKLSGFLSAETAEASTICKMMKLAVACGFRKVIFKCDCAKVIRMIQEGGEDERSYLGNFIHEILFMQNQFEECRFCFSHRECNTVAHNLARLALSEPNNFWVEEVPIQIWDMYHLEVLI